MQPLKASALLTASWAVGGCNLMIGLDDVSIDKGQGGTTQPGGAGGTAAMGGQGGNGAGPQTGTSGSSGGGETATSGGGTTSTGDPGGGGVGGSTASTSSSGGTGGIAAGSGGESQASSSSSAATSSSSSTSSGGATCASDADCTSPLVCDKAAGMCVSPMCGNGQLSVNEECDDGNSVAGDGCSVTCGIEPMHQCTSQSPSVCSWQEIRCNDGIDGDGDMLIDSADPDCNVPAYAPQQPSCPTLLVIHSVNAPKDVPDNDAIGAQSTIIVSEGLAITHTMVILDIAHPRDADVEVMLYPSFGIPRVLTDGNGGIGANYTASVFDSACPGSVKAGTPPFSGCYKPESGLPGLGQQAKGRWTLKVADHSLGQTGTLKGWTLLLCGQ